MSLRQGIIEMILSNRVKEMFKDDLIQIEERLQMDVITYFGYVEKELITCFHDLLIELKKQNKYKNDKLAVMLYTNGGQDNNYKDFYKYVHESYKELVIIVPRSSLSAGTIIALTADKIIARNGFTTFGMIDRQIPKDYNIMISIFWRLLAMGCKCEFNTRARKIDGFLKPNYEPNNQERDIILQLISDIEIEIRFFYDQLINHNLKDDNKKHSKALRLIEYLINPNNHITHNFPIPVEKLIEKGLNVNYYDDDIDLFKSIHTYDNQIYNITNQILNGINQGNIVNCFVHSRNRMII